LAETTEEFPGSKISLRKYQSLNLLLTNFKHRRKVASVTWDHGWHWYTVTQQNTAEPRNALHKQ